MISARFIGAPLKKISIDYAVMEPASQGKGKGQVVVVEMPVRWLDVGSWPALAETLPTDEHNNATSCPFCVLVDSDDNIVISEDPAHLVTTVGISDMIIVHTRDATLVCPKSEAQRVKELRAERGMSLDELAAKSGVSRCTSRVSLVVTRSSPTGESSRPETLRVKAVMSSSRRSAKATISSGEASNTSKATVSSE